MDVSFVEDQIGRNNRNQVLWAAIVIVIIIVLLVLNVRYLYNFALGPFSITKRKLLTYNAGYQPQQYYVTITGDDLADTGFDYVSTDSSGHETVESTYLAMALDDRFLLVESPTPLAKTTTSITGELADIPADVQQKVLQPLVSQYPDLYGAFLPLMLKGGDFKTVGYIALAIGAVVGGLALFFLIRGVVRMEPANHPFMKQLARYGQPESVASSIDLEMSGEHLKIGSLHISQHWLAQTAFSAMKVARMEDLAWGYKLVTQHRTNGIPTGKTYSAMIYDRNGTQMIVNAKEMVVDQLLMEIRQRAPWMIAGFSKELADAWKKERPRVIAAVDARKQANRPV